jgi:hypothetical protein
MNSCLTHTWNSMVVFNTENFIRNSWAILWTNICFHSNMFAKYLTSS